MDIRAVVPTHGGLKVFGQPCSTGLPQTVAHPIADQRVQARVEENGQNREFDAGTPVGGGNDVAADRVSVLVGQIVQKELLDFGGRDQFRLNFVCGCHSHNTT